MSRRADDMCPECSDRVVDREAVVRVIAQLPDERERKTVVDIHDAIADDTRLRILLALSIAEMCVCDLAEVCGISESGTSHQLRVLRDRDLVAFRRDGKRAVYRLADDHVRTLLAIGLAHAEERR